MVGFKSNTGWGLVLLSLEFPEGTVLRLGLSMNRMLALLWIRTFSHWDLKFKATVQKLWVTKGKEKRVGRLWCAVLFSAPSHPTIPTFSRACAWPCQLGEHLLHELPAARLVCLPCFHQVAGRVHHPVHQGSEGAPPTAVFILNTFASPERYLAGNLNGILCIF